MIKLRYLITGTGRCGTVFMARFLSSVGIPCGHESVFDYKGLEEAKLRLNGNIELKQSNVSESSFINGKWEQEDKWVDLNSIIAESSYMAAPFLDDDCFHDAKIIHVVRNPIKVVNSFCNYIDYFQNEEPDNEYEKFIYNQFPELKKKMASYDRCSLFYILWNDLIDGKSDFFHRIEDDKKELLNFFDKNCGYFNNTIINSFKKPSNRFSFSKLESVEIKQRLKDKSELYGYILRDDIFVF